MSPYEGLNAANTLRPAPSTPASPDRPSPSPPTANPGWLGLPLLLLCDASSSTGLQIADGLPRPASALPQNPARPPPTSTAGPGAPPPAVLPPAAAAPAAGRVTAVKAAADCAGLKLAAGVPIIDVAGCCVEPKAPCLLLGAGAASMNPSSSKSGSPSAPPPSCSRHTQTHTHASNCHQSVDSRMAPVACIGNSRRGQHTPLPLTSAHVHAKAAAGWVHSPSPC